MEFKTFLGLTAFLLAVTFVHQTTGYAGYQGRCRQSSPNPSDQCDGSRFLTCHTRWSSSEGFCDCVSTDTMYFNETSETCFVLLNSQCTGGFGSPGWGSGDHGGNRSPQCGPGSTCERSSGRCLCERDSKPNSDNRGCSGAGGIAVSSLLSVVAAAVAFGSLRIYK